MADFIRFKRQGRPPRGKRDSASIYVDSAGAFKTVDEAGTVGSLGGGGSQPAGAAYVFPFANAGAADDAKGSNGDLAILLDTGTIIQKAGGTWAIS